MNFTINSFTSAAAAVTTTLPTATTTVANLTSNYMDFMESGNVTTTVTTALHSNTTVANLSMISSKFLNNEILSSRISSSSEYNDLNSGNSGGSGGGALDGGDGSSQSDDDIINNTFIQATFCILYTNIFVLGIFGNVLVCYVVFRNRAMQTVTNLFITNLALSDILLCVLAVPFTPLYTFLQRWVFGTFLCHLVPYAQGCSVYISTLTLTSIAIDRFFVIIFPFHPRMKLSTCISLIISIWTISLLITLPYGFYMRMYTSNFTGTDALYCEEAWEDEYYRKVFGSVTSSLQFLVPFIIISICYISVSIRLNDRVNARPGSRNSRREEADRDRKKRTNRMLIAMVTIFGMSWLPINVVNIFNDFYSKSEDWIYYKLIFFIAHCAAMSSTCYNPFLYAWLNENFRKEFKQVLPFFHASSTASNHNRLNANATTNRNHHNNRHNLTDVTAENNTEKSKLKTSHACNGDNNLCDQLLSRIPAAAGSSGSAESEAIDHHKVNGDATGDCDPCAKGLPPPGQNPSKQSVDEILLSDVKPTITQETIVLPSGVLETQFDTTHYDLQQNSSNPFGSTTVVHNSTSCNNLVYC